LRGERKGAWIPTRIDDTTKAGRPQALKREYLRCFGVRTTSTAALQEVVLDLIRQGVSRKTLALWAVRAGFGKRPVSSLLSRVFCALGLRQRRTGAGRKASPEGLELLAHAYALYGDKCPKVLRGALWAWKNQCFVKTSLWRKSSLLQPAIKAVEINKGGKLPPGFCRPARRERGAYPPRSATSEQRSWAAKEQGRLLPLFISTA
jgi:hypothetical protein